MLSVTSPALLVGTTKSSMVDSCQSWSQRHMERPCCQPRPDTTSTGPGDSQQNGNPEACHCLSASHKVQPPKEPLAVHKLGEETDFQSEQNEKTIFFKKLGET